MTTRETHFATVTNIDDDEQRGRIKVSSGSLVGTDGAGTALEYPDWIEPAFPYTASSDDNKTDAGWFFLPNVGCIVEIEINTASGRDETAGEISFGAPQARWRACLLPIGAGGPAEEFITNYPNRRGIKTARGHLLLFDDTDGDESVQLVQANATGNSFLSFDADGSATLLTSGGMLLLMDQSGDTPVLTLTDGNKNILSSHAAGLYLADDFGNMIQMGDSGNLDLISGGSVMVTANAMNVFTVSPAIASGVWHDNTLGPSGAGGLTAQLAAALTDLIAGLATIAIPAPYVAATATAFVGLLSSGAFVSTKILVEGE